ncbi:hypothetical protein K474DRAFT_1713076 [Panus rudis PR-1116 ss-1]|nr:hypothetical protein K474DRAFT_1713076 [Panus rudis PR-1116 ss-1]
MDTNISTPAIPSIPTHDAAAAHSTVWLPKFRLATLSAVTGFAVITLGTSSHYIATTLNAVLFIDGIPVLPADQPDTFSVLNVAIAGLTLLTLPVMVVIDLVRKGAVTSTIIFELIWLGILCILWVAAAGFTADTVSSFIGLCKINPRVRTLQSLCKDSQVSEAFGFLSFISLLAYVVILLATSIVSSNHGNPVWKSSVNKAQFKGSVAPVVNAVSAVSNQFLDSESLSQSAKATPVNGYPPNQHNPNVGYFGGVTQQQQQVQMQQVPQGYQPQSLPYNTQAIVPPSQSQPIAQPQMQPQQPYGGHPPVAQV